MEVNEAEILRFKLNEYKESLLSQLNSTYDKKEEDDLRSELAELHKREKEIKVRLKELKQIPKLNKQKILEIKKKLKAINQLL